MHLTLNLAVRIINRVDANFKNPEVQSRVNRFRDHDYFLVMHLDESRPITMVADNIASILISGKEWSTPKELILEISSKTGYNKEQATATLLKLISDNIIIGVSPKGDTITCDTLLRKIFYLFFNNSRTYEDISSKTTEFLRAAFSNARVLGYQKLNDLLYTGRDPGILARDVQAVAADVFKEFESQHSFPTEAGVIQHHKSEQNWAAWRKPHLKRKLLGYKIYVAFSDTDISVDILNEVWNVFTTTPASSFKIAFHPHLTIRPDRIILYAEYKDELSMVRNAFIDRFRLNALHSIYIPLAERDKENSLLYYGVDFRNVKSSWRDILSSVLARTMINSHASDSTFESWLSSADLCLRFYAADIRTWGYKPELRSSIVESLSK